MPNQFEYSRLYKKRFYAPDNTILLVAGDFDHGPLCWPWSRNTTAAGRNRTTPWRRRSSRPRPEAKRAHYRLAVQDAGPAGHRLPRPGLLGRGRSTRPPSTSLAEIAFSPSSPLYQTTGQQGAEVPFPGRFVRRHPRPVASHLQRRGQVRRRPALRGEGDPQGAGAAQDRAHRSGRAGRHQVQPALFHGRRAGHDGRRRRHAGLLHQPGRRSGNAQQAVRPLR